MEVSRRVHQTAGSDETATVVAVRSPKNGSVTSSDIEEMIESLKGLDWRLLEISLTPVQSLEQAMEEKA